MGETALKRVLVTGATGTIGREVVSRLRDGGHRVRAMTRDPERAHIAGDVELVRGELADPQSLGRCADGVEAVFLVWAAPGADAASAVRALAAHAPRIVLLTSPHKTPHPMFQQPNPLRAIHANVERQIEDAGVAWTFLRPGMFAANALAWWAPQIRRGDVVRWPYADAPTAPIHEKDIAEVAVRALVESGHDGAEYVLTGPESLTQAEQVRTIGDVIGRPLQFEELPRADAAAALGFPPAAMNMLLDAWAASIGQPAYLTSTVFEATGHAPRSFREWVSDHARDFDR